MNEWCEVSLSELLRCQSGFAFKSRDWATAGVPVVKIRDVRSGVVRLDGVSFVARDTAAAAERFLLRRGDVLITMSGEIGAVGVYKHDGPALLNQRVGRFDLLDPSSADLNFLSFALQDPAQKRYFESVAYGVAQPNISPWLIGRARVRIPSLPTQRRIAAVLSAFDEVIEINERRIERLENLARSLYREWFVQFRFPGRENVELIDSELGPIPEGWNVAAAAEMLDVNPRISRRQASYAKVTMADVDERFSYVLPSKETDRQSGSRFGRGDVLFARITPCLENGKTALALFLAADEVGIGSTEFIVLRGVSVGPAFVYCAARSDQLREHAIKSMSGSSGRQRVANECFDSLLMVEPAAAIASRFENVAGPMLEAVFHMRVHSAQLAATRDLLLPRLVTGRLDISDIDLGVLTPLEVE